MFWSVIKTLLIVEYVVDNPDELYKTSEQLVLAIKKNYDIEAKVIIVDSNEKFVLYKLVSN